MALGGIFASIGAVAKAAAGYLNLTNKQQDQLDRQESKQDGARAQKLETTEAENEELRKDLEEAMRPSSVDDALRRSRDRAERLCNPCAPGDKPD